MPRSHIKGLFCDKLLMSQMQKLLDAGGPAAQRGALQVRSRRSCILPDFVGYKVAIHSGNKYSEPLELRREHIGHKFGEFALTRQVGFLPEGVTNAQKEEEMLAKLKKGKKKGFEH